MSVHWERLDCLSEGSPSRAEAPNANRRSAAEPGLDPPDPLGRLRGDGVAAPGDAQVSLRPPLLSYHLAPLERTRLPGNSRGASRGALQRLRPSLAPVAVRDLDGRPGPGVRRAALVARHAARRQQRPRRFRDV